MSRPLTFFPGHKFQIAIGFGSIGRNKQLKSKRNPEQGHTSTAGKLGEQSQFLLASACDTGFFALFDLPAELVENIISEMMNVLGLYGVVRLRVINSKVLVQCGHLPALTS